MVDRAGERGVKVIIENCVMEGWPRVEAGLEVAHRTLRPLLVR